MSTPGSDEPRVILEAVGGTVTEQVAWAIHCWSCPLCESGEQMVASGQGHVTGEDLMFAAFLIGALGLKPAVAADEVAGQ